MGESLFRFSFWCCCFFLFLFLIGFECCSRCGFCDGDACRKGGDRHRGESIDVLSFYPPISARSSAFLRLPPFYIWPSRFSHFLAAFSRCFVQSLPLSRFSKVPETLSLYQHPHSCYLGRHYFDTRLGLALLVKTSHRRLVAPLRPLALRSPGSPSCALP